MQAQNKKLKIANKTEKVLYVVIMLLVIALFFMSAYFGLG